jgi:hypothetical protein
MKKFFVLLMALTITGSVFAQDPPEMAPPAEVKKLDWMIGNWKSKPSMFYFQGMEMEVASTMKVSYDGQFIKTESVNDYGVLKMTETLMLGYDFAKNKYRSHAFTNMSPEPRIEDGDLKGDTLVMVSRPWVIMGDESVSRATLTKDGDDKIKFKLEFKMGDDWSLVNESTFERVKG